MTENQMVLLIALEMKKIGSLRAAAREWKVSPSYLSDVLNGRRAPGPSVLNPLRYEKIVTTKYEKISPDHVWADEFRPDGRL